MQIDNNTQQILMQVVSSVSGIEIEALTQLVNNTNSLTGCKFVSMNGYNSDESNNTELANHVINVGFVYENMKTKDSNLLVDILTGSRTINTQTINLDSVNYNLINTNGKTIDEYKSLVRASYNQAYDELIISANAIPGSSGRENNDIYLNKVLVFNTNTRSLSIIGQSISKTVTQEGEIKITKKAPLTLAKELIKKAAGLKTNSYRRFKVENLQSTKIAGDTIEIF